MLTKISTVLLDSPSNTTNQVEVTARAVAGLTQRPDELSPAAQVLKNTVVSLIGAMDALKPETCLTVAQKYIQSPVYFKLMVRKWFDGS